MPANTFEPTGVLVRESLGDAVIQFGPTSIYPWSPVFRATLRLADGLPADVVVKRSMRTAEQVAALARWQHHLLANGVPVVTPLQVAGVDGLTVDADGSAWIAYRFVHGHPWDGSLAQIAAAGRALGLQHSASTVVDEPDLPPFKWPQPTAKSTATNAAAIRDVIAAEVPGADALARRWSAEFQSFPTTTFPAIRDAGLPTFPVTTDFRVTNLIFRADGGVPTMVDFENVDVAPRLLDLAHSVLLFALETEPNPGRLFDAAEWVIFRDAYLAEGPALTAIERELWTTALQYMRLEFGAWHLTEGAEWDWPGQAPFLRDLLTVDERTRFPLE